MCEKSSKFLAYIAYFSTIYIKQIRYINSNLSKRSAPRTQAHLGATRPRVGIANLGFDAPSWQYLN